MGRPKNSSNKQYFVKLEDLLKIYKPETLIPVNKQFSELSSHLLDINFPSVEVESIEIPKPNLEHNTIEFQELK